VDERCVPPTDDQSNYKLANEFLLSRTKISPSNIHRIKGELEPSEGAREYGEEIRRFFGIKGNEIPAFDVIHRGIGPDAHTASLFPGEPLIGNEGGLTAAVWVEKMKSHRVTLLPAVLRAGRHTVIQAAGADKAEPIYNVLFGPEDPFAYPCQIGARGSDRAIWFLDQAAAARLPR
jgi:6-phosphogluconolactonase